MAGDWIKMRGNLWDDPRVSHICDMTESTEGPVIGALYWLWATADQHTEDGLMPKLTMRGIDRKTNLPGFAEALVDVGWIEETPDGIVIMRFEEHNGASAKRRCVESKRKATSRIDSADIPEDARNVSASDADKMRKDCVQIPPSCVAREREEIEKSNTSSLRSEVKPPRAPRKSAATSLVLNVGDLVGHGVDERHAREWLKVRDKRRAPLTQTAWELLEAECRKAGITTAQGVQVCAAASWQSLDHTWNWRKFLKHAGDSAEPPAPSSKFEGVAVEEPA